MWNKKNSKATPAPAAASAAGPPPRPSNEKQVSFEAMAAEIEQIKKERDQERREKVEAQQREQYERQQKVHERQQKEHERQEKQQAQQELANAFVPVRNCIANAPITTVPLLPRWGPPDPNIQKPSTKSSTAKQPSWEPLDPAQVMEWPDDMFGHFLRRPDQEIVQVNAEDMSIIELILRGRCDGTIGKILSGKKLGSYAGTNLGSAENPLEFQLSRTLWVALDMVCGGDGMETADMFPIAQFLKTRVLSGNESAVINEHENIAIGSMPPHLRGIYETDKSIEAIFDPQGPIAENLRNVNICDPENGFPTAQQATQLHQLLLQLARRMARINIEMKPDYHHPIKFDESRTEEARRKNAVVSQGLRAYIKSVFYNAKYNPAQQATTYCLATLTRYFLIATGNRCTYGYVDILPDGSYCTYLTCTFDWSVPNAIPLGGHVYPHFEIMVRFLLAGKNDWWLGPGYPESLKVRFRKPQRGDKKPRPHVEDEEDDEAGDDGAVGGGNGGVRRGQRGSGGARSSHGKGSSSGGDGGSGKGVQSSTENVADGNDGEYLLATLCWADLWDQVRFAIPATNPVMEGYMGKLPGDAELLAEGRTGQVYRKTLQGRDVVVKVVVKSRARRSHSDGRMIEGSTLAEELAVEATIYGRAKVLQQLRVIPVLLWYGEMVPGMMDALATEYAGKSMDGLQLTEELVGKAKMALHALHEHGILHGDIAKRNFVVSDEDERVRILDFAFSKLREDMDEETWTTKVAEEWKHFCDEFGIVMDNAVVVMKTGEQVGMGVGGGGGGGRKRTFQELVGEM